MPTDQREGLVTVSEAKIRLHEIIRSLANRAVLLLRHGKPVAAMLSYNAYIALLDKIEELEDRLSVYEASAENADMAVPWEKVQAEAGLLADNTD